MVDKNMHIAVTVTSQATTNLFPNTSVYFLVTYISITNEDNDDNSSHERTRHLYLYEFRIWCQGHPHYQQPIMAIITAHSGHTIKQ